MMAFGPGLLSIAWEAIAEYALEAIAFEGGAVVGQHLAGWLVPRPPKRKHRKRRDRKRKRR